MEKDWVALCSSIFTAEIEVLKNMLSEHEITAIVLNQRDSSYLSFGEVTLYVRNTDYIRAKNLIDRSSPETNKEEPND